MESVGQIWEISQRLFADKDFSRAFDQWESGAEPYLTSRATLLEATAYSPEIVPPGFTGTFAIADDPIGETLSQFPLSNSTNGKFDNTGTTLVVVGGVIAGTAKPSMGNFDATGSVDTSLDTTGRRDHQVDFPAGQGGPCQPDHGL